MRFNFSFLRKYKKQYLILGTILLISGLFLLFPGTARAEVGKFSEGVANFVGAFVAAFLWLLGKLLVLLIYLVVWVAQYNDFISSAAVTNGWTIVRDICNMFFILVLLVIAFATVLNIEKYSWKHLLPKLLIMAVLINFSKLICGVIIDFAQVVMLTFVNGFRDIAGGNFGSMLGILDLLSFNSQAGDVSLLSIAGTYILAVMYVLVSLVVITVILFVLIIRIVMLWILVVLSPLAYLLKATPSTEKYASQWWDQFTNNVVSGPILAFFIWLAFVTMQTDGIDRFGKGPAKGNDEAYYTGQGSIAGEASGSAPVAGLAQSGTPEGMLRFVISIGLLMGGLMITKQLSGAIGSVAGKGLGTIGAGVNKLKNFGKTTAVNTGKGAAQVSLRSVGAGANKLGNLINTRSDGQFGQSLQKSGKFINSWGKDIQKTRRDDRIKKRKKTLEHLGMKADTMDALKEAAKTPLGRSVKGIMAAGVGAATANPFLLAAGISHAFVASNKDHIAKGLKDTAVTMNQNRQGVNAFMRSSYLASNMSKEYKEKEEKKRTYQESQAQETSHVEGKQRDEISQARASGKSAADIEADINRINEEYNKRYDSIADHYKKLADKAEQNYQETTPDTTLRNDEILSSEYENAQATYRNSIERNDRRKAKSQRLSEVDHDEQDDLNALEREKNSIAAQYSGPAQKIALERFEDIYKEKYAAIKDKYKTQRAEVNREYEVADDVPMTDILSRGIYKAGEKFEDYQPNRLTIEAAKSGSKEVQQAKDFVTNMAKEDFSRFGENDWSTGSGVNDKQKKIYKILASGSKEAKAAMQNLIASLQTIRSAGPDSIAKNKKKIESLKKGTAYYIHEDKDGKGGLKDLLEELNQIDTGDDKKAVDKYGPHTEEHAEEDHAHADKHEEAPKTGGGGGHDDSHGSGHH